MDAFAPQNDMGEPYHYDGDFLSIENTNTLAGVDSFDPNQLDTLCKAIADEEALKQTEYETKIRELEQQLQHHKSLSAQLQTIALENPPQVVPSEDRKKRKYTVSNYAAAQRTYVNDTVKGANIEKYGHDLLNGVGFEGLKPKELPRALLRAYISFRYAKDHPKNS